MYQIDSSIYEAQDLADLINHCEQFGNIPLFVSAERTVTFRQYCIHVKKILTGLTCSENQICILAIKDQVLLAEVWMAVALSGRIACLLPDKHSIPDSLAGAFQINDEEARRLLEASPLRNLPKQDSKAVCTIAFSSGTTSAAKGVMLSQRNLLLDTEYSLRYYRYYEGMRLVHILPYWHLFGLGADLLALLHCGSSIYIPSEFHQIEALSLFNPHSINIAPAFADLLVSLLKNTDDIKKITGSCLKRVVCGGAPFAQETEQALFHYGILPCSGYGLTECSPCVSITRGDDVHPGTSGVPLECVKIRFSSEGEILVSGDTIMCGYYKDSRETQKRIQNGWFHTGDLGYIDHAGNLVITGRLTNMIVLPSGKKCIPEEIESALCRFPEIRECCLSMNKHRLTLDVVSILPAERVKELTDTIMIKNGLIPYDLCVNEQGLKRNSMGKIIR